MSFSSSGIDLLPSPLKGLCLYNYATQRLTYLSIVALDKGEILYHGHNFDYAYPLSVSKFALFFLYSQKVVNISQF